MFSDSGIGNIDSAAGSPSAQNTLVPLSVSSTVLPAINSVSTVLPVVPTLTAQTPAGLPSVNLETLDLSSTPLGALVGGTLNAVKLSATLDRVTGATSRMTASLGHLNVLGGLVSIDALTDQDSLQAAPAAATASRTIDVGHIGLLNIGTLLQGLGIDPARLPLGIVTNLLGQLKLPGLSLGSVTALLNAPLLEVDTGPLSVVTKASSSPIQSAATVTAQAPSLKVAGLSLGGDLTSLLFSLQSTLSSLLGTISSSLGNMVSVSLMDSSHRVSRSQGYIDAVAQASQLTITIDPSKVPGGLSAVTASWPAAGDRSSVGAFLGDGASQFSSLSDAGLGSAPLAIGPTTLTLGAVTSESKYTGGS
jgi:hypothetical protein